MRISSSSYTQSVISNLQTLQSAQQEVQTQLTTGQRINSSEEDPTAAAKVLSNQQEQRELIQYQSNTDTAQGVAQAGYDALEYLTDLSDQAASVIDYSSFDETDSAVYAEQIQSLIDDALSVANGEYNDTYLFGGTSLYQEAQDTDGDGVIDVEAYTADAPFTLSYTDKDGNAFLDGDGNPVQRYVYNGNEEGISVSVADGVEISPYADGETNQAVADFLNSMLDYKEALESGDKESVEATSTALSDAEDELTTAMSSLSMTQYRLEMVESRNSAAYTALGDEITSLRAADLNEVSVQMLNIQNAYSAALTTTSSILSTSLLDYV
jgi:flagellar hook-associated protein 3 FlgL